MKVLVNDEDVYPVSYLTLDDVPSSIDLPDALIERYVLAAREFSQVQILIGNPDFYSRTIELDEELKRDQIVLPV